MPNEYRRGARIGFEGACICSTRHESFPRPNDVCRVSGCCGHLALLFALLYRVCEGPVDIFRSRSLCHHAASSGEILACPACRYEQAGSHQRWLRALCYRERWLPTAQPKAACPADLPQDGASCPVCRDPSEMAQSLDCPLFSQRRGDTGAVGARTRPIDLVRLRELV